MQRDVPGQVNSSSMSYEAFLAWADEDVGAEWVNGEILLTPTASSRHQDLVGFFVALLGIFVEARGLGKVLSAPFQMKIANSGREPDVLFLAKERLARLTPMYLDGPADLVIEIVSPESAGRDRGDKFYEYGAGGVPEYWLIDPQRQWVEFYRREGEHYHLAHTGAEGVYHAMVLPGFWLRVEWLWQEPLPQVLPALRELGVL